MVSMAQQLPRMTHRIFAAILAAIGVAYSALLVVTYLQTTAPSSLGPDLSELDRLLFHASRPISPMERRLEAADTPLGTGPLISGPASMPLPFSNRLHANDTPLSATELAEREGE